MRVFLDTNVIVSAVTTRGLCADVFRTVLAEHELVISPRILDEVRHILKSKFAVPDGLVTEYVELIEEDALMADTKNPLPLQIKDKSDIKIVTAAVGAGAQVLVTGDREIQGIKTIGKVRVLSPREFWEELTADKAERGGRP
jgi:uncharacterized protein